MSTIDDAAVPIINSLMENKDEKHGHMRGVRKGHSSYFIMNSYVKRICPEKIPLIVRQCARGQLRRAPRAILINLAGNSDVGLRQLVGAVGAPKKPIKLPFENVLDRHHRPLGSGFPNIGCRAISKWSPPITLKQTYPLNHTPIVVLSRLQRPN